MSRWDEEVGRVATGRQSDGRFVRVACPACPERTGKDDLKESLSVNVESGWWRCWKCDARGRLPGFADDGSVGCTWEVVEEVRPPVPLPTVYPLAGDRSMAFTAHRAYLEGRGLEEWVWQEAGLCAAITGRYAGRVIVPVVPGDLTPGFVARLVAPVDGPKYLCPPGMSRAQLYNAPAMAEGDDLLLAVEGSFDALAHWPDAVAFLGKPTESQVDILTRTHRRVAVVLDHDAWREGVALAQRLRIRGVWAGCVVPPPGLDAALLSHDLLMAAGEASLETDGPVRILRI